MSKIFGIFTIVALTILLIAGVSNFDSITLENDLIVGDDITVTDDVSIGGDLSITGGLSGITSADIGGDITLENDEIIDNGTDAIVNVFYNDSAAALSEFNLSSSLDTPNVVDNMYQLLNFEFNDDSSGLTDFGQFKVTATDVTDESEDSQFELKLQLAGTQTTALTATGALLTTGGSLKLRSGSTIDSAVVAGDSLVFYVGGTAYYATK